MCSWIDFKNIYDVFICDICYRDQYSRVILHSAASDSDAEKWVKNYRFPLVLKLRAQRERTLRTSYKLISLHIRSMWETIRDAWACWSGWNFGPNSGRIPPILKYCFRIPPPKMKIVRVQIREFQNTPQWKLSESSNPRVSEYPPKWKLSESPNLRVSENPPKMKIVRESKSESFRIPPQWKLSRSPNLRVSEYPPPKMKIVTESKSESFRISPQNENCQRVQIREFQNTPPPKSEKHQISNFRIVWKSGRSMWRLICNPPGYHSFNSLELYVSDVYLGNS